ncbi:hypothetical protein EI94DRAFT_1046219 [Lactarius quietus]|nr:hypothetical protein EI94DRAFT_1046219 [Lactarius quietus]
MAPTRTSKVKRLRPLFSESVPTSARRLRLDTIIKETRPGDRKMYDTIRPSTFKDSTPSSGSPWMNTASPILARSQSLISMWRSRPPNRSGGSLIQTVETEMHRSRSNPPAPASLRLRRSLRTTEGKALLPVIPLDIRIGGDEPQPSFVAAHIEEVPDEDQVWTVSRGRERRSYQPGAAKDAASDFSPHWNHVRSSASGSAILTLRRLHQIRCGLP